MEGFRRLCLYGANGAEMLPGAVQPQAEHALRLSGYPVGAPSGGKRQPRLRVAADAVSGTRTGSGTFPETV